MRFPSPFTAQTESSNGVVRIALAGELDMQTAPVLKEHLEEVGQGGFTGIIMDLRGLTYVDLSGLHIFLQSHNYAKTNGHRFVLIGATAQVRRVFEVTATEFLLDRQEAMSLLDQFTRAEDRRRAAGSASEDAGGRLA